MPTFQALVRGELHDPQLLAVVALRLLPLLLRAGRLREAEGVARSALALVVAARGEAVVRRAEKGIHGAPSLSAASVLQPAGGPEPYSSADDALQHHLASANAELLLWLLRTELRRGLERAEQAAISEHKQTRREQVACRQRRFCPNAPSPIRSHFSSRPDNILRVSCDNLHHCAPPARVLPCCPLGQAAQPAAHLRVEDGGGQAARGKGRRSRP